MTSKHNAVIILVALSRQSIAGAIYCIHIPNLPTPLRLEENIIQKRRACGEVKIGEEYKMRYAIIENGGKQYKVFEGANIDVDHMSAEPGNKVDLDNVLLVADGDNVKVGTPLVKGAHVNATVEAHVKGPKVTIFKYRPKQRFRVKTGHRQKYTRLQIGKILLRGKKKATKEEGNDGS